MEAHSEAERIRELEAKVEALQAYKDWTHAYLDAQGVPHHPPGTHGAAGCRIGDRMDWWGERILAAAEESARLRAAFLRFIEQVITVRSDCTPEWMEGIAENVNAACEAIGEKDRVRLRWRTYPQLPIELEIVRADA